MAIYKRIYLRKKIEEKTLMIRNKILFIGFIYSRTDDINNKKIDACLKSICNINLKMFFVNYLFGPLWTDQA